MYKNNAARSKIPIPVDPLPPLSENVLMPRHNLKTERHPLETIYQEQENKCSLESTSNEKDEDKKPKLDFSQIDSRYVTTRTKNCTNLNYKIFDDNFDDFLENRIDNHNGECSHALTPALKSPKLHNRVRNVKKSLKRPHSRELQGISPLVVNDIQKEVLKRRLDFTEGDKEKSTDSWSTSHNAYINQNYGADFLNYLLKKETIYPSPRLSNTTRACAINWLIKISGPSGNAAVLQTAIWYFDSRLACNSDVSIKTLQAVAVACYWISLKIHGKVISAKRLIRSTKEDFPVQILLTAERDVIMKLNFPVHPTVPQEFISYMSWICDPCNFEDIEMVATIFCTAGMMVDTRVSNAKKFPSVLGAAAVRNALLLLNKKELLIKLKTNYIYKTAQNKSYNLYVECGLQRASIRTMASQWYTYKVLLQQHDAALIKKIVIFVKDIDKKK